MSAHPRSVPPPRQGHRFVFLFTRNPFFRNQLLAKQYPVKEEPQSIRGGLGWYGGCAGLVSGRTLSFA